MISRYVISESLDVRQEIKASYNSGRSIVTDTSTVLEHTNCHQFGKASTCDSAKVAHNLRMAAGQLWVFSSTDVQVMHCSFPTLSLPALTSAACDKTVCAVRDKGSPSHLT